MSIYTEDKILQARILQSVEHMREAHRVITKIFRLSSLL